MHRTLRNGILSVILFASAISCAQGAPNPQAETKPPSPPARPAQAQIVLAPGQPTAVQAPPKEQVPADARKTDGTLRVGHTGLVQALAFSPDRRWLASGGDDKNIIVWNLSAGREEFRLGGHKERNAQESFNKDAIISLAFSPDGTRLLSADNSGIFRMWSLQTQKLLFTIRPPRVHHYGVQCTFSPDGKSLIIPIEKRVKEDTTETALGFFDADSGKSLRTIPTKWDFLSVLVPLADGRLIAGGTVGSDDDDDPSGSVEIFDANSGEVQKSYPVVLSAISPDGRWMTSFDEAGVSGRHGVLWNLSDGKRAHDLPSVNSNRLIFRPDGEEVAIMHGESNAIDFVSTAAGGITKSFPAGGYGLGVGAYSADGKLFAAASYDYGTIKVWDLSAVREQVVLYGQSPVESLAFNSDGKLLAVTSRQLRVWDISSGKEIAMLTDSPVTRAVFSADGKWLAANPGGQFPGKALKIWSTQTWKEVGSLPQATGFPALWFAFSEAKSAPPKIGNAWSSQFVSGGETHIVWASSSAMAVSPDGKWLAQPAGGADGTVEIWDAGSGQKVQRISAHKLAVIRLSFSRDGRWLISVGQDSNPMMVQGQPGVMIGYPRVSVWDTRTCKLEFSVEFPSSGVPGVDTSADGKFLAVSKGAGLTQLFDLEQKKPVAAFASPDVLPGSLAVSPDGTFLVQGAQEGVRLWRLPASPAALN